MLGGDQVAVAYQDQGPLGQVRGHLGGGEVDRARRGGRSLGAGEDHHQHRRSHGSLPLDSVDPNKLYTLSGFAGAISMNDKSMIQVRDASLERIRQDKAREKNGKSIEIPDSEEGEHGKRGAKYSRSALGGGGITAQTKDEEGEPPATASEAQRSATPY